MDIWFIFFEIFLGKGTVTFLNIEEVILILQVSRVQFLFR